MALFPKPSTPLLNTGSFLSSSLVMALPMSEAAGGALADISGNGFAATIAGVEGVDYQWVTDPDMGVVLELLTGLSWVDLAVGMLASFTNAGTMMCWLKLNSDAPPAGQRGLANFDAGGGAGPALSRTLWPSATNQIESGVFRPAGNKLTATLPVGGKDQWHLLAITTLGGALYEVWLNGVLVGSNTPPATVGLAVPFQFGRSDDVGASDRLAGLIGDIRLWNRQLAGYEINTVLNNPWGLYVFTRPSGAVSLFPTSADYAPRHPHAVGEFGVTADATEGPAHASSELFLTADVNTVGGAFDPPTALPAALSPERKPALAAFPAPATNGGPLTTNLLLALLYNDAAGAQDPLTDYGPNSHQASGITWGAAATVGGVPAGGSHILSDQASEAYASGNGGSVLRAASLEPLQPFSIAITVRFPALATAGGVLAGKFSSGGTTFSYALRVMPGDADRIRFEMTDVLDGQAFADSPNLQIVAGNAYVIMGTYDGAIMRLFIDGLEVATQVNAGNVDHGVTADLGIGQDGAGGNLPGTNAHIGAVFLWARDLTLAEASGFPSQPFGMFCNSGYVKLFPVAADYVPRRAHAVGEFSLTVDVTEGLGPYAVSEFSVVIDAMTGITNAAGLSYYSILPNVGPDQGGQAVTIKGRNFVDISQVLVGGLALTSLVVVDGETITGVTGAHLPGLSDIRIDSSTRGTVESQGDYTYVGGFGPAVDQLIVGRMVDESFFRQESFTGEAALLGVQTTLGLTLADIPIHPEAVELYVRRISVGELGGRLMRQGGVQTYTVDIALRKIVWEQTASFALAPADELVVAYLARGEI